MKAIELYKFLKNETVEWHWFDEHKEEKNVMIFLYYHQIEDFSKLLSINDFDDEGISCVMKDGYFAIPMRDLLEDNDIELNEVFTENESDF